MAAAWKARALTAEGVKEIDAALGASAATIEGARYHGGDNATGVSVSLSYEGEDIPRCGNDLEFWLKWHLKHGGVVTPPVIIINGTPRPEFIRLGLNFGTVPEAVNPVGQPGPLNQGLGR